MFGSKRGASPVPLIIMVVIWLFFTYLCWHCYSQGLKAHDELYGNEDMAVKGVQQLYEETLQTEAELKAQLTRLSNLVGFLKPTEEVSEMSSSPEAIIVKLCSLCNGEYSKKHYKLNLPAINDVELEIIVDREKEKQNPRKGLIKYENLLREEYVRQMPKLEDVWNAFMKRIEVLQEEVQQKRKKLNQLEKEYKEIRAEKLANIEKINQQIKEQKDELLRVAAEEERELRAAEAERNRMRAEKLREKEEVAKLAAQLRKEKQQFEAELEKLQDRVKEMEAVAAGSTGIWSLVTEKKKAQQKPEEVPDGEIIFADHENGVAYINIGRPEGVVRGLKFDVYRIEKGGKRVLKGEVEVKKVQDKMSLVGILKTEDPFRPLKAGDVIINPVFDKDKIKYFVFAGRLCLRYSNEEAHKLIEALGGKVEERISARTDYVVLGANYRNDPNYKRAVEIGIETMREQDLLRYIGE